MEFRNHQTRILHQYKNLTNGNPFVSFLLGLVFLIVLIPFIVLALAFGALMLIITLIKISIMQLFGRDPRQKARGPAPFGSPHPSAPGAAGPSDGSAGGGTVLDVEATVRTKD